MPSSRAVRLFGRWAIALIGAAIASIHQADAAEKNDAALPVRPEAMHQVQPRTGQKMTRTQLIERGRQIFNHETFAGNGRTCATCHPASNNFTIDPLYVAKLRRDDPLFVAETNPDLRRLENSRLLRSHALITANIDGFDIPGVLRSVPHVLGLGLSITPDPDFPLTHMTGWSGDGAPGKGSLREFAIGAVTQHLPKTLARKPGKDFRVPSDDELDALLAYQLSLGQQELLNVEPGTEDVLTFRDAEAREGMALFHLAPARGGATNSCFDCHYNAGANDEDLEKGGTGNNFATGTNRLRSEVACRMPGDGGFGKDPVQTAADGGACGASATFRGDGGFNVPSLVAAAETPPFFHNNGAATLEEAITFYTSDTFNDSPAGNGKAFALNARQIRQIAAFLRAVNAYENATQAVARIDEALTQPRERSGASLDLALRQVDDAIEVLAEQKPPVFAATGAAASLRYARDKLRSGRPGLLAPAKVDLERARSLMAK